MPMQVLQGMPVQLGSLKNGKDPGKSDPAEFLNALAALLAPNTQPQPLMPDQGNFSAGNLSAASISMLSLEQGGIHFAFPEKSQGAPTAEGLTASLLNQVQENSQLKGESLLAKEKALVGEYGTITEEPQILNVLVPEPRLEATEEERIAKSPEMAGEIQTSELRTRPQSGKSYSIITEGGSPDDSESLPLAGLTPEKQEAVHVGGSKNKAGREWTFDGQREQEAGIIEDEPAAEKPLANQDVRFFAEQLAKNIQPGRESKAFPQTEFQVAGRELAQEFPRIIESQLKTPEGQEIKRDIIIHLEPKELGKLTVKVTAQEGIISVHILAEQAETRNLVESGLAN